MYLPPNNGSDFVLTPSGTHLAICYRVIDLGTQRGEYMGKEKIQRKVLISWEIPDEQMSDGRPFTIGQRFTWSMSEKATLRHVLESWRGKAFSEEDFGDNGFDIKNILGVGCMLNVVHAKKGDKTYANIATVARLPKGMVAPPQTNKTQYVWLSREEFDRPTFDELSDALKGVIIQSPEYRQLSERERISDEPPMPSPDDYGASENIPF